ncbi:MAG: hypothetical protein GWN01_07850 [Nitrosopumilaceae archaeon]|nr:hypothetical protein [Nitrosopumilaceae archaeon]NIU00833.1 hypothetical protein [Nitrosopumilaceae archaeon]NIU87286.1 hypothetical protein [Nitrosopumilaceae archaeon]NIV65814.1 hypothetical protein [Nitrosopumilaceae archaeon]NIX61435.1 hypothetical protein [Nitrosopumilaceae archaeon]
MVSRRKAVIITVILGMSLFGYSQYATASKIGAIITDSELIGENDNGSKYNVQLEFDNPSLLVLTAGETDFSVFADKEKIGDGKLSPFTLPALGKTSVNGEFQTNTKITEDNIPTIKISGITNYDVLFTSFDVPFVYYPTEEQAREFIRQN